MDGGGSGGFRPYAANFQNSILPPFPPVVVHPTPDQEILFPESFAAPPFHGGASSTNTLLQADPAAAASWLGHLPDVNFGNPRSFPIGLVPPAPAPSWVHHPENALIGTPHDEEIRRREEERHDRSSKGVAFIKGQWTEEEDRLLVRLVHQYGDRRWSAIASKIVGRAGKQCRERWHNHLRPDIKKDSWTEEEERLLVEVHEQLGNRWSEIAKRIPGRSENAIKNHWNATKRRQFSKRRMKSLPLDGGSSSGGGDGRRKSVVLQNYIKYKYFSGLSLGPPGSVIPENPSIQQVNEDVLPPPPLPEAAVEAAAVDQDNTPDSPSLLTETYDDEISFMQNLFGNGNSSPSSPSAVGNNAAQSHNIHELAAFGRRTNEDGFEEDSWSTYLASDPSLYEMGGVDHNTPASQTPANNTNSGGYLPYLLDGAAASSYRGAMPGMMNIWCSSASNSAAAAAMHMDFPEFPSAPTYFPHGYGSCTKPPRPMF